MEYGGNKQKIASAVQAGVLDPTVAVMAGMFIDRMRAGAAEEQAGNTTVAQDILAAQGLGATPEAQQLAMGQERAMAAVPPSEAGLAALPVDESMVPSEGYAGGGIVAFAQGDLVGGQDFSYRMGKPKHPYEDLIIQNAISKGIDPIRDLEILYRETGAVKNAERAISPKGATGLMQIMPSTAVDPGFGVPSIFTIAKSRGVELPDVSKMDPKERTKVAQSLLNNPELNAEFGSRYRAGMERRFGTPELAAAAYNAGPGRVIEAGGVPNIPETQKYVAGISPQRQNFLERQEAASKKVREARREQLASGTLAPTGQPIIPGTSVMEKKPEPAKDFGTAPSPYPSKEDIASRQQSFSDYLYGRQPLPAPTRGQEMIKQEIEKQEKEAAPTTEPAKETKAKPEKADKRDAYGDKLEALLSAREGRLASQREEDKNMALLAAGLGIMSGRSPYALQNIGAGAMKGVEQYSAARKLARQEEEDILAGRLGQFRYGEESRIRAEDRARDQGMRLASTEEKRIRDEFTKILGNVLDPRNKQLTELIKRDPDYVERMAIEGRNRILQGYGIDIGEAQPTGAAVARDYSKWGKLNVGK